MNACFKTVFHRYRHENIVASNTYKSYNNKIPNYLWNRPRKVVKHCMERIRSSTEIDKNKICRNGGCFSVESQSTKQCYEVVLSNSVEFPKCSCMDFKTNFLPCKHMFAVFEKYADVSWLTLPEWYRESVYMTLDNEVVKEADIGMPSKESCEEVNLFLSLKTGAKQPVTATVACEEMNSINEIKTIASRVVSLLNEIRNVCFDVRSVKALRNSENTLKVMLADLLKDCQHDGGLRVAGSTKRKSLKRKRSSLNICDDLPRKHPKPNRFASRVGKTANEMKSLHSVNGLIPSISSLHLSEKKQIKPSTNRVIAVSAAPTACENDLKKNVSQFTPSLVSVKECDLGKTWLKNGPHAVTLLQLKSLEPVLPKYELTMLKAYDRHFNTGWLYDEIINGYLWRICKQNSNCLYVSSTNVLVLQNGGSITKMWKGIKLHETKFILMHWNPSGSHWILLVVDILQRTLIYLDPLEQPCLDTSLSVKTAKDFTNTLLLKKFSCCIDSVQTRTRLMQQDMSSCGVFVCMYGKKIATGGDLCPSWKWLKNFRKEIFDTLSINCIKNRRENKNKCFLCEKVEYGDWIACTRCGQWMHCHCVPINKQEGELDDDFTCPLKLYSDFEHRF